MKTIKTAQGATRIAATIGTEDLKLLEDKKRNNEKLSPADLKCLELAAINDRIAGEFGNEVFSGEPTEILEKIIKLNGFEQSSFLLNFFAEIVSQTVFLLMRPAIDYTGEWLNTKISDAEINKRNRYLIVMADQIMREYDIN